MTLADDLRGLRDRALADLNAAHDYYTDTQIAWNIVARFVDAGNAFAIQKTTTGTRTTQVDLVGKSQEYVTVQLAEATFQQFLSIFENLFFDLLRLWLTTYPRSLIGKQVDFRSVLDAPDKKAITLLVINRELNEVLYERPAGWFAYLDDKVKLGCPSSVDEIDRFAEAKASRDVIVHNRGVAGKAYEAKAGPYARYKDGEKIDISEPYHRETWELIRKVVTDISNAAAAKAA